MTIKINEFLAKTRTIEVTFQGETCNVTYRLNTMTPAVARELDARRPDHQFAVDETLRLVESWDVVDEQGQAIPPEEIAEKLPTRFLFAVIDAVLADMRAPEKAEKKDSGGGSSET